MLEGMRHVQETRGMTHLDVKGPNFFVDGNGVVKVGDFGTAKSGSVQQLFKNPIDNSLWTAPEVLKGDAERAEQVSAISKMAEASRKAATSQLDRALPDDQYEIACRHLKHDRDARAERMGAQVPAFSITSKADTWSVGVEVFRAFTGKFPFDADRMYEIRDKIRDFPNDPNNRVTIPTTADTGLPPDQLADLNALIGGLMHPDPQQRLSLTDALQSPLFQLPGVGGQAARDVIKQL
jgi:serine/threonine protein kinase